MEKRYFFGRRKGRDLVMSVDSGEERERDVNRVLVPEIPMEPMKFLTRSWSQSASGLSKVLVSGNRKRNFVVERLPEMVTAETVMLAAAVSGDDWNSRQKRTCRSWSSTHHHSIGNWFHYKDYSRKGHEKSKESRERQQPAERPNNTLDPTRNIDLTPTSAKLEEKTREEEKTTQTHSESRARVDSPRVFKRTARMRVDPRWWGRQIAQPTSWRVDASWWAQTRTPPGSFPPWVNSQASSLRLYLSFSPFLLFLVFMELCIEGNAWFKHGRRFV